MPTTNYIKPVTVVMAGLVVIVVLVGWFWPSADQISIDFGGPLTLQVKIEDNKVEHGKVLEAIWSEKFSKDGALGWLREKGVYHYQDSALAERLKRTLPEDAPQGSNESAEQRTKRLNKILSLLQNSERGRALDR